MRVLNTESGSKPTLILFVLIFFVTEGTPWAQEEQDYHKTQLRKAIVGRGVGRSGVFFLLSSGLGLNSQGPEFTPIIGLRDPTAVPYLLDVLQNGSGWSDGELPKGRADMYRYVARCYAALCLGNIGDLRAFAPLLATLDNTSIGTYPHHPHRPQSGQYNLRACAAFALGDLGDPRAVAPLVKSLRQDGYVECVYALARLNAISAVPVIVQVASERELFSSNSVIHSCLETLLKVRFTLRRSGADSGWQVVDQFPELRSVPGQNRLQTLWLHWIKVGDKYAKERFEQYYPQWKAALRDKPNASSHHGALKERMLSGGVAALPYLMGEIEKGDASLVRAAAKLAKPRSRRLKDPNPQLLDQATRAEALDWWRQNRQKWTVFQKTKPDR